MYLPKQNDFFTLIEAMPLCIILHDAHSKEILWANAAALSALGFTLEELTPLKAPDMTRDAPKYRRSVGLRWLEGAARTGQRAIEWCYRSKQGVEILSEAVATLVHLEGRDVLMVQFRDISREDKVKRDLKRFESRLKAFMQDLAEGVAVLGPEGEIRFISDSGANLLNSDEHKLIGKNFLSWCDDASRQRLMQQLSNETPEHAPFSVHYRVQRRDGEWRWHDATCRFIEIEDDLVGHLLLFRDVTEQVRAEDARRVSEQKIEYLARYNAMGEMAVAIAHELSQPLAATRNFIEGAVIRLGNTADTDQGVVWGLQSAVRQIEHASVIIKSVRDYVVKLEQSEELIDLNELLRETRYFISLRADPSLVKVQIVTAPEPLRVSCEKVLIGQVILNLAFNAIEEMADLPLERRVLRIHASAENGVALVRIEDRGRGIQAEAQEKLFDGFFSSKVSGNGIGLALCKNIIGRHRGDIWAQNLEPCGAVFSFSLPLATHA
ncbi:PAS domain S-box protein [Pseudomonas sp. PCH199]|uniref:ATP-binding protein n=1 Tax=unclassified Pseudomonas TaxID=196821 RepID=UPI000BC5110E|nr:MULTISPECIES: ATP-binding protein [unclassified Pseudomonas]MCW8278472.1 PAS domain S-box protein [Pseudomonas sp. PCH199]PAM81260.1 PAS domain-containing sensor histidine kinase [Pseudomonas sp. ERMR1:02]